MKIPAFSLNRQIDKLKPEITEALNRVVSSGQFILGRELERLEESCRNYLNAPYAYGVSSGTDALWLALKAAGVGPGDQVITSPFTFFATASAIVMTGAVPVFADVDPISYNLDPEKLESILAGKETPASGKKIDSERVKAVIVVHLYGQTAEMQSILDIASRHGLTVVEDACQAFGAKYNEQAAGVLGDIGCFSFFPTKNLGAFGDAGLVTTKSDVYAENLRSLRVHGSTQKYQHDILGGNCRMDAMQAAILNVKIPHIQEWVDLRRDHAANYTEHLKPIGALQTPSESDKCRHSYHQYTLRVHNGLREAFQLKLQEEGIGSTVYYPIALHLQPALQSLGYQEGDFPVSEKASQEVLSLPMYPELTGEEAEKVIETTKNFFNAQPSKNSMNASNE